MDTLSLFLLTVVLGLMLSWLLHRSADAHASDGAADEEFFQCIQRRSNQNAPGGSEGAFTWTQTNDEVELVMALDPHLKANDVEFRILPVTVRLGIRGAAKPLLEVRAHSAPARVHTRLISLPGWQGKLHRKVQSDECNWSIGVVCHAASIASHPCPRLMRGARPA